MLFILRKWITICPTLFIQIRNDMPFCNSTGFLAKEPDSFFDSSVMMSNPAVPHPVFFSTLEFIKPLMHFFIRFAKQRY